MEIKSIMTLGIQAKNLAGGGAELQFHSLDGSRGKSVSSLIFLLISTE